MSLEKSRFVLLELPPHTAEQEGLFDDSGIKSKVKTTSGEIVEQTISWYSFYVSVVESLGSEAALNVTPQVLAGEAQERQVVYELSVSGVDENLFTQAMCDMLAGVSK